MKDPDQTDPTPKWVTRLSWPDKLIARCFPRFFSKYAPEEIKDEWDRYQEKKHDGKGGAGH